VPWLKERIALITCHSSYDEACRRVAATLTGLGLAVEGRGGTSGDFSVPCLALTTNLILWRCWADRLHLQIRRVGDEVTTVTVHMIPNLWRTGLKSGEEPSDVGRIVASLRRDLEREGVSAAG
jgi:hypothetical protein